jgi:hypothetical protein
MLVWADTGVFSSGLEIPAFVVGRRGHLSQDDRPRLRPNDLPFILALEVALSELLRFYNIIKQKQLKSRATLSNPFMGDPR